VPGLARWRGGHDVGRRALMARTTPRLSGWKVNVASNPAMTGPPVVISGTALRKSADATGPHRRSNPCKLAVADLESVRPAYVVPDCGATGPVDGGHRSRKPAASQLWGQLDRRRLPSRLRLSCRLIHPRDTRVRRRSRWTSELALSARRPLVTY
jgi:hypothetical protein